MRHLLIYGLLFGVAVSCITPIDFGISEKPVQLVVEGRITNLSPPYVVILSHAIDLNEDTLVAAPEIGATVVLHDDLGNSETFVETDPGTYETSGIITGTVGRKYHISIETKEGNQFESKPEELRPVGRVTDIRFEYEDRTLIADYGEIDNDVFNIFIDSDGGDEEVPLIRWKMTGIYRFETYPELNYTETPPYTAYKDPWPCSGYIVVSGPIGSGGILEQIGPCTCCECWAYKYQDIPQLSDKYIVEDNQYQNIKVGEVPITYYTFYDRYQVAVEQSSLNQSAFDYYKSIRSQKLSASDLFQPQVGELLGNIEALGPDDQVIGLFYAASVSSNYLILHRDNIPYPIKPITFITNPCYDVYLNATNEKPESWVD